MHTTITFFYEAKLLAKSRWNEINGYSKCRGILIQLFSIFSERNFEEMRDLFRFHRVW